MDMTPVYIWGIGESVEDYLGFGARIVMTVNRPSERTLSLIEVPVVHADYHARRLHSGGAYRTHAARGFLPYAERRDAVVSLADNEDWW